MSGLEFLQKLEEEGCQLTCQREAVISGDWTEEYLKVARGKGYRILNKPCVINELLC